MPRRLEVVESWGVVLAASPRSQVFWFGVMCATGPILWLTVNRPNIWCSRFRFLYPKMCEVNISDADVQSMVSGFLGQAVSRRLALKKIKLLKDSRRTRIPARTTDCKLLSLLTGALSDVFIQKLRACCVSLQQISLAFTIWSYFWVCRRRSRNTSHSYDSWQR